jgi:hypothetical protein
LCQPCLASGVGTLPPDAGTATRNPWEGVGMQRAHADQHIDRRHDVALGEQAGDDALDSPEHRVVAKIVN